jgi:hypothetical protein
MFRRCSCSLDTSSYFDGDATHRISVRRPDAPSRNESHITGRAELQGAVLCQRESLGDYTLFTPKTLQCGDPVGPMSTRSAAGSSKSAVLTCPQPAPSTTAKCATARSTRLLVGESETRLRNRRAGRRGRGVFVEGMIQLRRPCAFVECSIYDVQISFSVTSISYLICYTQHGLCADGLCRILVLYHKAWFSLWRAKPSILS